MEENQKKATLKEYLQIITDLEEGLVELRPEQLGIVFDGLRDKIDGYVELSQYMLDRAAGIKARSKMLLQQAKYLENSEARLKSYLAQMLDENDSPEIYGSVWRVAVTRNKKVEIKKEIDEDTIASYPELMTQKIEYKWDKTAIKAVLKNMQLDFAELKETVGIRVRVNK